MRGYLQLVATGPELSKSLTEAQAEDALGLVLGGEIGSVRSAIFLIALRMKRETDAENAGALNALQKRMQTGVTDHDDVMAIADPFNGFVRGLTALPFLPAVLATCGLPAYCHGLERAGPKYGITPHRVLKMAGKDVDLSVPDAITAMNTRGWCYIDQAQYIPPLHDVVSLRDQMVKRTCLSTLEVVLKPLSGRRRTHLLTGFVHKAYPPVYAALARQAGFDTAAVVRGVEGGCIPSLSQLSRYFGFVGSEDMQLHKLTPSEVGIEQTQRMIPISDEEEQILSNSNYQDADGMDEVLSRNVAEGVAALSNKEGPMRDSLVYGTAIALAHAGVADDLASGAEKARKALSSGEALERFNS